MSPALATEAGGGGAGTGPGSSPCPCGSGATLAECCGPLLDGRRPASTAQALMRSRYTAYALGDDAYLRYSWHPGTCPADAAGEPGLRWLGLKILAVDAGGEEDASGRVEFVARYKRAGRAHRLHELSEFSRCDGRWVYLRGRPPGAPAPGRDG